MEHIVKKTHIVRVEVAALSWWVREEFGVLPPLGASLCIDDACGIHITWEEPWREEAPRAKGGGTSISK